jgi:hypothetical protein
MRTTPLRPQDMNKFAGQFVQADSPMFDLLPKGCTIVVGGTGTDCRKPDTYESVCFLCGAIVLLVHRDDKSLAAEKTLCILCPECYFKMEPQEAPHAEP